MSLFDLGGKVALITGSTKGIGKAIAGRMAEHGARVVISSRKADVCEAVVEEIRSTGGAAMAQPCNIKDKVELQTLVDATLKQWGRIDILVCNAAVNPFYGPSAEVTDEVYDRVMNTNVRSNFWLSNMVLPEMAKTGGGSVIAISSIAGLQGNDKLGVYALSKAAEMQLVRNLALEWGPQNIRANCIAPGLIRTNFSKDIWSNPNALKRAEQMSPLNRIGEPDDIAGAAVFLASASANFMTGQTLLIDGGRLGGGRVAE